MLRAHRRHQDGYSLIELMIVVMIIGVLAAIAIPNFLNMQCKARTAEAKSILKSLYTAQIAYFGEAGNLATDHASLNLDLGLAATDPATLRGEHYAFWIWANNAVGAVSSCMGATGDIVQAGEFSICYYGPSDPRNGVLTITLPPCL